MMERPTAGGDSGRPAAAGGGCAPPPSQAGGDAPGGGGGSEPKVRGMVAQWWWQRGRVRRLRAAAHAAARRLHRVRERRARAGYRRAVAVAEGTCVVFWRAHAESGPVPHRLGLARQRIARREAGGRVDVHTRRRLRTVTRRASARASEWLKRAFGRPPASRGRDLASPPLTPPHALIGESSRWRGTRARSRQPAARPRPTPKPAGRPRGGVSCTPG